MRPLHWLALALLLFPHAPGAAATESVPGNTPQNAFDLPIMGDTTTSYACFYAHASSRHRDLDEYYALRIYRAYESACEQEGVSLVVALAQMIHETDYLLFTGAVSAWQYNFAGLGSTSAGNPGVRFPRLDEGVIAHVQHLKAYGSTEPLAGPLVDPRWSYVARGSATTVMQLTGRWATDPLYGEKVLAHARMLLCSEGGTDE
jgi:hypothetical protein